MEECPVCHARGEITIGRPLPRDGVLAAAIKLQVLQLCPQMHILDHSIDGKLPCNVSDPSRSDYGLLDSPRSTNAWANKLDEIRS
jgi:hypothetical protein